MIEKLMYFLQQQTLLGMMQKQENDEKRGRRYAVKGI